MLVGALACFVHGLFPGSVRAGQRHYSHPPSPHGEPPYRAAGQSRPQHGRRSGRLTDASASKPVLESATFHCHATFIPTGEVIKQRRAPMETPVRISFQGSTPSEALTNLISEHLDTLERLHGRLTSCQVVVQVPDRHHRTSNLYSINIHLVLPGQYRHQYRSHATGRLAVCRSRVRRQRCLPASQAPDQGRRASSGQARSRTSHERVERTLDRPPS